MGPVGLTAAVLLALVIFLHAPVFTQGRLITPAGMHHAMWPWRAFASEAVERGAVIEANHTLSDLMLQVYPWQLHAERSFHAGSIPLWNPLSYCGTPFIANAQSAVFFPLHWPAWVFPSMRVFTLAAMMKILLAGLFMGIFLRGLGLGAVATAAGAAAFALCGFMTGWLGYAHTNAAIFLPLLMHAAHMLARRPGADGFLLLTFAGAAQYLGGHPETSLHIVAASALYLLWCLRRSPSPRLSAGLFVLGSTLAFALAAVQMFPFIGYLQESAALASRQAGPSLDPVLPVRSLVTYLLPGLYGRPESFTYHGPAAFQATVGYVGTGVVLLALLSLRWMREVRFFAILTAACAAIVYGPGAVHAALRHVPILGITSNNRLLLLIAFGLAVMGARGLDRIGRLDPARHGGAFKFLGMLAALTVLLLAIIVSFHGADPAGATLAAGIVLGTALLVVMAVLRPAGRSLYAGAILLLVCLDMGLFAYGFNPHADPAELFPRTPLIDFLRKDSYRDMTRGGRMMTIGWSMRPEMHMVFRLRSVEGYDAMELASYQRLSAAAGIAALHVSGRVRPESRPLLDLMGLRYLVTPPGGVVSGEAMRLAYDGPDGRVFVNEQAQPRFLFVDRALAVAGGDSTGALAMLASGGVDPARVVLLENAVSPGPEPSGGETPTGESPTGETPTGEAPTGEPATGESLTGESPTGESPAGDTPAGETATGEAPSGESPAGEPPTTETPAARITLERDTAGSLTIAVRGHGRPGYLVVLDTYEPGWTATIDGRPAALLRADHCFRAVPVPARDVTVEMTYRPFAFRCGVWVSMLSLLGCLVVGIVRWGKLQASVP